MNTELKNERRRVYTYSDGHQYSVEFAKDLVLDWNGELGRPNKHVVTDQRGTVHEISGGWRTLTIIPRKGNTDLEKLQDLMCDPDQDVFTSGDKLRAGGDKYKRIDR